MDDRRTDALPAPSQEAPFEVSVPPELPAQQAPVEPEKTAAARKPKPRPDPDDVGANVKETLESILVAFILAFIFRAYVVEAWYGRRQ